MSEKSFITNKHEKNKIHKEFGLISNFCYVLASMWKYSKCLVFMIPLVFFITPVHRYLCFFLSKYIIDIINKQGSANAILKISIICSGLELVLLILQTIYTNKKSVQCIIVRLKMILERNSLQMNMPFENTENPDVLDCCQKADNAIGGNKTGFEGMEHEIFSLIENLGVVFAGIIILGTMNPMIVVLTIFIALINFYISNIANKYSKERIWDPLAPWWRKRWYMDWELANFEYAKDIRVFRLQSWLTEKFKTLNIERYEVQKQNTKLWFWVGVINNTSWVLFQGIIYSYLIYSVYAKKFSIGSFSLYLASSNTFFAYISSLLNSFLQLIQRSREIDDFRSFMEIGKEQNKKGLTLLPQSEYSFQFCNVSFKYPWNSQYALKNLNITIKAGERLAIVGLNGAGKSTFIKLLLRLYSPTEGKILLNGVDINEYEINSFYKIFSPVFQDERFFAFSLAENISMCSVNETNFDFALDCLNSAGLGKKLERLEKGLNTQLLKIIDENGIDLSGGQKQKLALARALYKNSPVVILDEPTSALDPLAENKLYSDFDKIIKNKTAIYISHRLSSTKFCNNVAVFKNGEMIEYGSHELLMALNGEYAKMYKVQSKYYSEIESGNFYI